MYASSKRMGRRPTITLRTLGQDFRTMASTETLMFLQPERLTYVILVNFAALKKSLKCLEEMLLA